MKVRTAIVRHIAIWALFAGLLLRAAIPVGYMPSAFDSGLLFELCPGQLPAGFVMPGATSAHEHHHHSSDSNAPSEPDTCQVGHLLSSTAAVDTVNTLELTDFEPSTVETAPAIPARSVTRLVHRSRGPPA